MSKLHINEVSCIYLCVSVENKFLIGTKRGTIMVVISGVRRKLMQVMLYNINI